MSCDQTFTVELHPVPKTPPIAADSTVCLMEQEVCHGEAEVYTGIQA